MEGSAEPRAGEWLRPQHSFGLFALDLDGGFLHRDAEEVVLRPKPFEVLVYLVEHHGRLVTKAEVTGAVWPDTAASSTKCSVTDRTTIGLQVNAKRFRFTAV